MSMPSIGEVIFTQTSADNTVLLTPALNTQDYDAVSYFVTLTGGVAPAALQTGMQAFAKDGITQLANVGAVIATGAGAYGGGWGPGCTGAAVATGAGYAQAVPPMMKFSVPAFGIGITAKITVWGRRNHRGPDVSINAD